jgi:hypothetical protein
MDGKHRFGEQNGKHRFADMRKHGFAADCVREKRAHRFFGAFVSFAALMGKHGFAEKLHF